MQNMIIGIDNGISGGLVALSPNSQIIACLPMPSLKARKGNEIDIATVWRWITGLDVQSDKFAVIVEEPGGSKSAKAATSMAGSFHALRSMCVLKDLRWHRITPQLWQKAMLPGCAPGDTKPRALAACRELWPAEPFLASERCRCAHEGLVDAALIAEYARRKNI